MNLSDFIETIRRLERMHDRVQDRAGSAFSWLALSSEGIQTKVTVVGVKSFEAMSDDVLNAFIWSWSVKDALKPHAVSAGMTENEYEQTLTKEECLALCSDIANGAKHSGLTRSRSGKYATLGILSYVAPLKAIGSVTVSADWVTTVVEKPEEVLLKLPILDRSGNVIGDAFKVLECSALMWEKLAADCGIRFPPVVQG